MEQRRRSAPRGIGLDLDNTIIDYRSLAAQVARELALASPPSGGKRALRDALRGQAGGDAAWQRLQALIYGERIGGAVPYDGVAEFLAYCRDQGIPVSIVSHKSEFAAAAPAVNLRSAARGWLRAHRVLGECALDEADVYFAATRAEKLAAIRALDCALFVDDLPEVFLEPGFPAGVERWLFAPEGGLDPIAGVREFSSWAAMLGELRARSSDAP